MKKYIYQYNFLFIILNYNFFIFFLQGNLKKNLISISIIYISSSIYIDLLFNLKMFESILYSLSSFDYLFFNLNMDYKIRITIIIIII